ncbi:hypothetical protein CAPTEDRAFT_211940 [Capitella teleta]|uniref:Uncharacterized protein n=1 Tax=Capitella teleta TaxID=283909 RepID=R7V7H7_CAPTE|nr:hypothetical protein CAPTEDRAFT_211940 [Capitella teleta]|eukprot:ELU14432.1 hypothetical protein CAPTEDRAFT_211940 [Capitella teleta]
MIQVDVFWAFGMGAVFAAAAHKQMTTTASIFINRYFVFTVCYLSLIFAPSGIYLLWQHTAWETMFFLDKQMHGLLPLVFAHTNVGLGVLGFYLTACLIRSDRLRFVPWMWTVPYTAMFSILTFGYNRFLYPGTEADWKSGVQYSIPWDFFHCEVFRVLIIMSVFVLPPLFYAAIKWPSDAGITKYEKSSMVCGALTAYLWCTLSVLGVFVALLYLGQLPDTWGLDRPAAFLIGQVLFGCPLFVPLLMIGAKKNEKMPMKKKKKKRN